MNRKYKTIFFTLLLALISTGQLHAESFRGKLVDVLSGDTVEILHDGKAESVRLAQIYAPVKGQPFGVAAKNFILRIASNENVTVRFDAYDLYGMPLGEVFLSGGTNLNKLIVSAGYAWRYEGYSNDPDYVDLEVRARGSRILSRPGNGDRLQIEQPACEHPLCKLPTQALFAATSSIVMRCRAVKRLSSTCMRVA